MFNLNAFQVAVNRWHKANFPQEPDESFFVIAEELGELARAIVKGNQGIRGGASRWQEEKEREVGDLFISLIAYCNQNGFNASRVIAKRWETVGVRVSASAEEQAR